ncbi:dna repair protein-like protein rad18 [Plenodomus tracheiphilus IPT5]|uniref:Dna repair protein-like protein rad18 n=1 Tax=Plenodomus tracheiphilus IPT5 TaxID=1408161 RepID=A0A6A7B4V1_9PLEO|nr:dna repair protein-like protein rad18 [Plenodomus tracheiphilus IPT5]
MAAVMSAKRHRAFTNDVDVASTAGRNKRPRRTPNESDDSSDDQGSETSSKSDAHDTDREQAQEYEQMTWATQQVQKDFQASTNKQNIETDSGIIEEIQCVNFMCHEHLTVPLGPNINFIIGHNGSGKSAVLTALTICLGGKATATNRAQNLKSLIKEGKDHSVVTVRIKNQGPLAYKPSQYGKSIVVERHFNRTGASGFKLKDQNGKIVSTRKAELEDILDAFSMQIDNPMNVLTQDMARQFLNHSTPKDKYKFFLQGTQLENLNRDYQQIEQSLETMNIKAAMKKEDLGELRSRMEHLEKQARLAQNLEKLRAKEKEFTNQVAWAHVQEDEVDLQEALDRIAHLDNLIRTRNTAVEQASLEFDRADQALAAAKQNVSGLVPVIAAAKDAEAEAATVFKDTKEKQKLLQSDERKAGSDVTLKSKDVKKCEINIEQHRLRQAEADNGLYAEKVRELETAKLDFVRAREARSAHDDALPPLREQSRLALAEKMAADQKVEKAREDERRIRNGINNLKGGRRNWIDSYQNPQGLNRLLEAIAKDRNFREKPVGPLGRHVKLLKPEWGYILEKQFGQSLNAFAVTSKADSTILSRLMKQYGWSSPIFIGKRTPIDTSRNEPENPNLLTWMKALKIEDHLVRNQFIINQGIEQTVLIESREEGSRFMHTGGQAVRNVRMCFTFADGDQRKGRVMNFTSSGGINDSPIDEYRFALRMQLDQDAQIRAEETRLAQIRHELQDLEQASNDAQNRLNDCISREQDHHAEKRRLTVALQRAQDVQERLDAELSDATPESADISVLEESLKSAREELQRTEGIYEDLVVQKHRLNDEAKDNKKKLDEAQSQVAECEFSLNKQHATVRKLQGTREDQLKLKNKAIAEVTAAEDNKQLWVKARNERELKVEKAIGEAEKICPERVQVPVGKSAEELQETLTKLEATRRNQEKQLGGSQEELLRRANDAKHVHKEAMQELVEIDNLCNHLIKTLNTRRDRWKQFRSGISVRARVTFNYLLSERKFRGTLSIDHKKALLDIHVQPDIMERSGDGRQTKTLSGGEKSYSTVCLLLSLWDAMGSPIRCLDEFDVFMDSVNRERSMHMIIQAARRSLGRQFIFITPQSMNNVVQTSDVKIIKMTDPERGQTTLPVRRT